MLAESKQSAIEYATNQSRRLQACIRTRGGHFEYLIEHVIRLLNLITLEQFYYCITAYSYATGHDVMVLFLT